MNVKTSIDQTVEPDDKKKNHIADCKAEFYNGYLQRVKFRIKEMNDYDLRLTIPGLVELRDFFSEVIEFAEDSEQIAKETIEEGQTKPLKRIIR